MCVFQRKLRSFAKPFQIYRLSDPFIQILQRKITQVNANFDDIIVALKGKRSSELASCFFMVVGVVVNYF
nr:MAG TPA: hypothetical protein [Caudoviricetes sp.]